MRLDAREREVLAVLGLVMLAVAVLAAVGREWATAMVAAPLAVITLLAAVTPDER